MATKKKDTHNKFKEYMQFIISHPNYNGLDINKDTISGDYTWVSPKTTTVGNNRITWAKEKARLLGIDPEAPGVYAKVMFAMHPTKQKVCQICGLSMSIDYEYLNKNLAKKINTIFTLNLDNKNSIRDVVDILKTKGLDDELIRVELNRIFKLVNHNDLDTFIVKCIEQCRNGISKLLGPGAMSNFPDRFDGFHSYNRCCRSHEDTGRHANNLRGYGKDRRAYELWSDGNIHAANQFMTSDYFKDKGFSADHIGPISLGFIHDPIQLSKISSKDNSSKRDRISKDDIDRLIKIELSHNVNVMSWYSSKIWEFIKNNYQEHESQIEKFRSMLKQNFANYMEILYIIYIKSGDKFLWDSILKPKMQYFQYDYQCNDDGIIISQSQRNITDSTKKEASRFIKIAFKSINDYHNKKNRKIKPKLSSENLYDINNIITILNDNITSNEAILNKLQVLMDTIQQAIIDEFC